MKRYIIVLMVILFCVSCGSKTPLENENPQKTTEKTTPIIEDKTPVVDDKPQVSKSKSSIEDPIPQSTIKLTLDIPLNKVYPGGKIKAKITSEEEIENVAYGILGEISKSAEKPSGKTWEGYANITLLETGEYKLFFIVSSKEGQSSSAVVNIEVVNKPTFNVETSNVDGVDGQQKITVQSEDIKAVELKKVDGEKIPFTKASDLFEYQGIATSDSMLVITDLNDLVQEKPLTYKTQNAIIFGSSSYNDKDEYFSYLNIQTETRNKVTQREFIKLFKLEDEYMLSILPNAMSKIIYYDSTPHLIGISPHRRYLFLSGLCNLKMKKITLDSGRKLNEITLKYYYIYDRETDTNHLVGKLYNKTFHPTSKEKCIGESNGFYYYPVFWSEEELLVIQAESSSKVYEGNDEKNNKNTQTQKPSKCISVSLIDFTMKASDKLKPVTPWVCWADQYQGIISWRSAKVQDPTQEIEIPSPEHGSDRPEFVSDLFGHVWDLSKQAKTVMAKNEKYYCTYVGPAIFWKGKKAVLVYINSQQATRGCVMDIETGKNEILNERNNLERGKNTNRDFDYRYLMLNGTPSNPNQEPIAVLRVNPIKIDLYYNPHGPGSLGVKKDVEGTYVARITKDGPELLWKVDSDEWEDSFFITEMFLPDSQLKPVLEQEKRKVEKCYYPPIKLPKDNINVNIYQIAWDASRYLSHYDFKNLKRVTLKANRAIWDNFETPTFNFEMIESIIINPFKEAGEKEIYTDGFGNEITQEEWNMYENEMDQRRGEIIIESEIILKNMDYPADQQLSKKYDDLQKEYTSINQEMVKRSSKRIYSDKLEFYIVTSKDEFLAFKFSISTVNDMFYISNIQVMEFVDYFDP